MNRDICQSCGSEKNVAAVPVTQDVSLAYGLTRPKSVVITQTAKLCANCRQGQEPTTTNEPPPPPRPKGAKKRK